MPRTMPEILVTGGAGFISSELVAQLAAEGRRVRVLDNFATGSRKNLAGLPPDFVTVTEGDVRDARQLAEVMPRGGTVFHLACLGVRHSLRAPRENHEVNATGTLTLLDAARVAGVARFVHVSSSEIYGPARTVPMTEEHPAFPTTVYGAAKLAGESYARAALATHGLPVVVVRPFNAYGPRCHHEGDSGEVIPRFLLRTLAGREVVIFGDGMQTRDFTQVSDTARGIRLAGETKASIGATFNLGSGRERTIRETAEAVARGLGLPPPTVRHTAPRAGVSARHMAQRGRAGEK